MQNLAHFMNTQINRLMRIVSTSSSIVSRWLSASVIITSALAGYAQCSHAAEQRQTAQQQRLQRGDELQVRADAPERYTVQPRDTLWDISARFLNDPWRWPELWRMNKAAIKNPHLIYPGNVVAMKMGADGKPMLVLEDGTSSVGGTRVVKLSPRVRKQALTGGAIPSIAPSAIDPFLTRPLVVDESQLSRSPVIVATEENRVLVGAGNVAYVEGIQDQKQLDWQIYRPGKALRDPDSSEVIGYEAVYLGDAQVTRTGEPSSVEIVHSKMEINKRDRLVPTKEELIFAYVPRAPEKPIKARIVSAYEAVAELGQGQIVVLNKGARDGLERGHVLATYRHGEMVKSILKEEGRWLNNVEAIKLPDERTGLLFVFRTFDRVAYALVMNSQRPLHVGDDVRNPS
jgi:hypothetical protein